MTVVGETFSEQATFSNGQLADNVFSKLAGATSAPLTKKVGLCVMGSAPQTISTEVSEIFD